MSLRDPRAEKFELRLKRVFDAIDGQLERKYGSLFPLHPARRPRGTTANPEHDGLFDIGAAFTPGYGTGLGPSYVVDVNLVTLARVPADLREQILEEVRQLLSAGLKREFPRRRLDVVRRGDRLFITGDLRLDEKQ